MALGQSIWEDKQEALHGVGWGTKQADTQAGDNGTPGFDRCGVGWPTERVPVAGVQGPGREQRDGWG